MMFAKIDKDTKEVLSEVSETMLEGYSPVLYPTEWLDFPKVKKTHVNGNYFIMLDSQLVQCFVSGIDINKII